MDRLLLLSSCTLLRQFHSGKRILKYFISCLIVFLTMFASEWRVKYCDYKQLKKVVKRIKNQILHTKNQQHKVFDPNVFSVDKSKLQNLLQNPSAILSSCCEQSISSETSMVVHKTRTGDGEDFYETELFGTRSDHEKSFFFGLDDQLNKVDKFFRCKEDEYDAQAQQLHIQMEELIAMQDDESQSLKGSPGNKGKVQRAAKMLQTAFVEFYRGLRLLRNFSSLNMMAFVKILKKFDKVTGQNASGSYLKMVENSHFATSDKVVKFMDRVERVFTLHFTKGNRKQAMAYLRPIHSASNHGNINFILGLFSGCSWSLLAAFVLILVLGNKDGITTKYIQAVFPVFSTLFLFVLHLYMYGWNIYVWKQVRINYTFIFEFSPKQELRHQDVLLLSTGLTTLIIIGMIFHLATYTVTHVDSEIIALVVFLLLILLLICPLDICYKSSRAAFLRCTWRIISSPLFKVVFADFFLADQLTSQVPALRNLGYISCYYGGGFFRTRNTGACTKSTLFKSFQYLISVLPYWWRLMQCWRRWMDEHDTAHIANGGKYLSALIAVVVRLTYSRIKSEFWLGIFVISSIFATVYQLYWDIVVDWGLLQPKSFNPWLRDQLILKRKITYFLSMEMQALNVILRLAWIYSVTHPPGTEIELMIIDLFFAALEVIRRGHWNFYRLENEHLNNVGRYRAVRAVPLPFKQMDDTLA
ncbi:hypothetical protein SELMODRAFT_451422 [Selaginella moellendorffii]|uniref:EXS domain-containing protein n=1 Tax=Selaginella moellendorffii TaxID=88036 RepID=D8TBH5_SELML|nr:hypothetical protein SELMODRAFT_451422 [Selaginella moellendorffii]